MSAETVAAVTGYQWLVRRLRVDREMDAPPAVLPPHLTWEAVVETVLHEGIAALLRAQLTAGELVVMPPMPRAQLEVARLETAMGCAATSPRVR